MMPAFWADLIVIIHLLYIGFTVGGELLIVLGRIRRWSWIRRPGFRIAHFIAVGIVAVEALIGTLCPLTTWEYRLRVQAGQRVEQDLSFIARLVRSVVFYDFPPWVFTALYIGFGLLVGLTMILVPPRRRAYYGTLQGGNTGAGGQEPGHPATPP